MGASCLGIGIGEFHHVKVAEGHICIILSEVFDDPLDILPTKGRSGADHLLYGLLFGQVLDLGYTTGGRSRGNCETELIATIDGNAGKIIRKIWIPLIPG